jgi:release factor glutamine methyltransferase
MNTRQALDHTYNTLKAHQIPDPTDEARILLCHVTGYDPARLFACPDTELTATQQDQLEEMIARKARHEPTPYITGRKEFYGLSFYVNPDVLIPRPETELLVEQAIAIAPKISSLNSHRKLNIADVGTGSGAIAISIARNVEADIYAIDISTGALKVAAANCESHTVSSHVHLLQGNLLEPLTKTMDIIVANLPYISTSEMKELGTGILNFEPLQGLRAGPKGTEIIEELLRTCKFHLAKPGALVLEFGYNQKGLIEDLIDLYLPGATRSFHRDLAGLDRAVSIFV